MSEQHSDIRGAAVRQFYCFLFDILQEPVVRRKMLSDQSKEHYCSNVVRWDEQYNFKLGSSSYTEHSRNKLVSKSRHLNKFVLRNISCNSNGY